MIPSEEWRALCERFSRTHSGWLIRLWVVNTGNLEAGLGEDADRAMRDLTLSEITVEQHGKRTDMIIITRDGDSHSDHIIRGVESISMEHDGDGNESGLRIDSDDQQTTLLRFRVPADPQTLDGLKPDAAS